MKCSLKFFCSSNRIKSLIMKTSIVLLIALVTITKAASDDEAVLRAWNTFKVENEKAYESEAEEKYRKNIFMEKIGRLNVHNSNHEKGLVSFKMGINKYSDMTLDELVQTTSCFNPGLSEEQNEIVEAEFDESLLHDLPRTVDWRDYGGVTEVKEQGRCKTCWAFAATGAIEGQYFRESHKLVSLSEQQLLDCTVSYGNDGCNGGRVATAYTYVLDKGIEAESTYPYRGYKSLDCFHGQSHNAVKIQGYVNLAMGNEKSLQWTVAKLGPVAVGIYGSLESYFHYTSGVYYDPKCSSLRKNLNHALLVVGYGTDRGKDYWLAKNSLGKYWGNKGYIKIARNKNNHCGIASRATYPII